MSNFNQLTRLPFIPYKIMEYLMQDEKANDLWKLLKYNTYDALSHLALTLDEKRAFIWKSPQTKQEEYRVFLTPLVEDSIPEEITYIKLYRIETDSINHILAKAVYQFEVMFGGKISLVDYQGVPVNRFDLIEYIIISCLNGVEVGGVGVLQFNRQLSTSIYSSFLLSNSKTFCGGVIRLGVQIGDIGVDTCEY